MSDYKVSFVVGGLRLSLLRLGAVPQGILISMSLRNYWIKKLNETK